MQAQRAKRVSIKIDILISDDFFEVLLFENSKEIARCRKSYTEDETYDDIVSGVDEMRQSIIRAIKEYNNN